MSYIQTFGSALLQKLSSHPFQEPNSTSKEPKFSRVYWRSDVVSPNANTSTKNDKYAEANALFIDVTFDIRQYHTQNIVVRLGALIALPSQESNRYSHHHYVQSPPLSASQIHAHCRSIDVDITTEADKVADFLGEAFRNGRRWVVVRSRENSEWELQIQHVSHLQGEVGYFPLSAEGCELDLPTLEMILVSGNQRIMLDEMDGMRFWKEVEVELDVKNETEQQAKVEVETDTLSNAELNVSEPIESKREDTIMPQERKSRPTKTTDTNVYAHGRKTYIAGSKRKKPKFTLGSI